MENEVAKTKDFFFKILFWPQAFRRANIYNTCFLPIKQMLKCKDPQM